MNILHLAVLLCLGVSWEQKVESQIHECISINSKLVLYTK